MGARWDIGAGSMAFARAIFSALGSILRVEEQSQGQRVVGNALAHQPASASLWVAVTKVQPVVGHRPGSMAPGHSRSAFASSCERGVDLAGIGSAPKCRMWRRAGDSGSSWLARFGVDWWRRSNGRPDAYSFASGQKAGLRSQARFCSDWSISLVRFAKARWTAAGLISASSRFDQSGLTFRACDNVLADAGRLNPHLVSVPGRSVGQAFR